MDNALEKLIKDCEIIRLFEIQTQKTYADLLPLIPDEQGKVLLRHIIDDEKRHEKIAQQILDILAS